MLLRCPYDHKASDPEPLVARLDPLDGAHRTVLLLSEGRCPCCPTHPLDVEGRCGCCRARWELTTQGDDITYATTEIGRLVGV